MRTKPIAAAKVFHCRKWKNIPARTKDGCALHLMAAANVWRPIVITAAARSFHAHRAKSVLATTAGLSTAPSRMSFCVKTVTANVERIGAERIRFAPTATAIWQVKKETGSPTANLRCILIFADHLILPNKSFDISAPNGVFRKYLQKKKMAIPTIPSNWETATELTSIYGYVKTKKAANAAIRFVRNVQHVSMGDVRCLQTIHSTISQSITMQAHVP